MPITVTNSTDRANLISYLSTLRTPTNVASTPQTAPSSTTSPVIESGDWRHSAPGVSHHFTVADLPPPRTTPSAGNPPKIVKQPANATLAVPPGFTVRLFASGLANPRLIRVAPNGDIFLAETAANRIRVFRAADGADTPSTSQIFAEGLDRPFGMAFYPSGDHPEWLYVANNNSIVRFRYQNGDLKAGGSPEVIVPRLTDSNGGHSTRDIVFSKDGKRMFIAVGSGSNVAEGMSRKSNEEIRQWEVGHGRGASWDGETHRAEILVTDPDGKQPLHTFATGIRNGVSMAIDPSTGDLWTTTNERDALGDDLVPDYITRVKEGGFYGWPWYYLGKFEDPRHAGERPDLASTAIVPDVLLHSHSAPLQMTFYTATKGVSVFPPEYRGDIFAASHGSWNRRTRTGSKIIRVLLNHGVPTGEYQDFLTGFVIDDSTVWGRPVGVAVAHDGSLLVSEDGNGTVWRVSYTGR
jgi:glucose/arabinose dehydrogenase